MLYAIANALPPRMGKTPGRVGFALGPETFTLTANFLWQNPPISTVRAALGGMGFIRERMQRLRLAEMILFPL